MISNISFTPSTVSWAADPTTPDIVRIRPVGGAPWFVFNSLPSGQNSFTFTNLTPCTAYEVQVVKICAVTGIWSNSVAFSTIVNYCSSASLLIKK
ncbi:fibronectin type III domain-containing protein [Chryseobacterium sp.]|uniref:fibronectin type III domain-containing protein n=1 Tax=Chryseobacterium sp. TaxID=1871047 RepID=UPI00345C50E2